MSNPLLRLRLEDGSVFETPTTGVINMLRGVWEWVRDQDGNEVMLGPNTLASVTEAVTVRLGPGDLDVLEVGTAP